MDTEKGQWSLRKWSQHKVKHFSKIFFEQCRRFSHPENDRFPSFLGDIRNGNQRQEMKYLFYYPLNPLNLTLLKGERSLANL